MKPRDSQNQEKVVALNSLEELMGKLLYYAWLSDKFPNVSSQTMREKTAEQTAAMMTVAEIKAQVALFERIQFHKAEVKEFLEKTDAAEKRYEKKQAEFIESLNQANQDELKRITTKFQS
jgi:hypothetical protein